MTPMLKQYFEIKNQVPECILFYRLGDFYEMFYEDAVTASKLLEIALTSRDAGDGEKAPMCGVPFHSYEGYLEKLVKEGYKVAICEQMEDPKTAKGIVKRGIVRIVSPGTIIEDSMDEKNHNYFMTIIVEDEKFAISAIDYSTGELYSTEVPYSEENANVLNELSIYKPSEILINEIGYGNKDFQKYIREFSPMVNEIKKDFDEKEIEVIISDFNKEERDKIEDKNLAKKAIAFSLDYLQSASLLKENHINSIYYYERKDYMELDYRTEANLEITKSLYGGKKGSLLSIIDKTQTAMGGRTLKNFLLRPLLSKNEIEKRLDVVEYFKSDTILREEVGKLLSEVYDLERISAKLAQGLGNARDMASLGFSMLKLPNIYDLIPKDDKIIWIWKDWDNLSDISFEIKRTLVDDPPMIITDGGLIKEGFSEELDVLRDLLKHGKEKLLDLENRERERTGIKNLKIGYNRVFGYYFDVTKSNLNSVPEDFIRKQTLANSERFFTEELKELEEKILHAGEKSKSLEYEIFNRLRESIKKHIPRIQKTASIISLLDVLLSLAKVAFENNYNRPILNKEGRLIIKGGRHPVIEKNLNNDFISNDTYLKSDEKTMQLITGPNMSGKSTYMRQIALITLMAQIGSFVPADFADIPITDRIFSRIGASDNLSKGESTFMVEMKEVAQILNEATEKSLIILDEVGRGTGTYDGLSIAWAVAEYIVTKIKANTLFATHYHELTELSEKYDKIQNMTLTILEKDDNIIFLRKVAEGKTDRSFGIEVAKLAGVKTQVIENAKSILKLLETHNKLSLDFESEQVEQLDFSNYKKEYIMDRLENLDMDDISPKGAYELLDALHNEALNLRGEI